MQHPISDRKRLALETLERRFADKSKSNQKEDQSNKKFKKNNPNEEVEAVETNSQKVNLSQASVATHVKIVQSSASKQRNVAVSGCNSQRKHPKVLREAAHPVYLEITETLDENLIAVPPEASSRGDIVNKIVFDLLQHGDKGYKYTKGNAAMENDRWVHLDDRVLDDKSDARRENTLKSHSKRSKNHMTMRQHRKHGSLALPKQFYKFSLFNPMHEMWKDYITKILKKEKQIEQKLLVADLHGAVLLVADCKTVSFKGISGIMIRETAKTFGLITQDDQFRVVPKEGSVFIFQAGCWKITLHGDNLSDRNANVIFSDFVSESAKNV